MGSPDFSAVRALILDMDGVLWRSTEPIGDLTQIFDGIRQRGLRVVLASNNATLTVEQYLEKLGSFGVKLQPEQIVTSGHAAAAYLHRMFPQGGPVYVIGERGLLQALEGQGFHFSEQDARAVVIGMDRQLTYEKLSRAALLIRSGLPFIGTNPDRTYPTPYGLIPGVGAILAAVQAATDVEPVVVGKPEPEMYRFALERLGVPPAEALVVGDRIETDIVGAQKLGCPTALVLSGVTGPDRAYSWRPAPDWIGPDLASLLDQL